jgi:predicted RNase H-like nuclease (RuvC/YqgF family)
MTLTVSGAIKTTVQVVLGGAGVAALLTIAYTMWHDSNEKSAAYGENKASLAFTKGQLAESKSENEKLKAEKEGLQQQIDDLRKQLLTEQNDNKYDKKLLDESDLKSKQLEERVAQLSVSLKNSDPCAPLRKEISSLEQELQRPPYVLPQLNDVQRTQAESSLEKKYNSLDVCQSSHR